MARDIREAIDKAAADPTAPNNNIRTLTGVPNGFRIRVGDWRVSYTFDHHSRVINVFEIAPRGGAYR
jgi:mRNA interferase RelE/StbE